MILQKNKIAPIPKCFNFIKLSTLSVAFECKYNSLNRLPMFINFHFPHQFLTHGNQPYV